ncbi:MULTISPECIES: diguanylate cyclase domain-containing protein [unclassified Marinovum]
MMERCNAVMDVLCPMHLALDQTGHIAHVGPTLAKLKPDECLPGKRFLEVFELRRPRAVTDMAHLSAHAGTKLHLRFRTGPQTALKGVLVPVLDDGGGMIVNLSFGISVMDAVRDFSLTGADFAATDLAIEMLYLIEAKTAAMTATRNLNQKLNCARIAAEEQAFTDTLTGLKNRRAMDHVLARSVAGTDRFALMHLDLDFFKEVNDGMGHAAGDHVLQEVAKVLVEETRAGDTVARVGGDEFTLLLVGRLNRKRLSDISERIVTRLATPIPFGDAMCRVSASIGITLSEDYEDPDAARMQEDADIALYASKNRGRACHTFHDLGLRRAAFSEISPDAQQHVRSR